MTMRTAALILLAALTLLAAPASNAAPITYGSLLARRTGRLRCYLDRHVHLRQRQHHTRRLE